MNASDVYFEAEVGLLAQVRAEEVAAESQRQAELRAAARATVKAEAERREQVAKRHKHTVEVDDENGRDGVSVCLLDVPREALRDALAAHEGWDEDSALDNSAMQQARALYLCGRKADAWDAIYPAVRDAPGVAI